MPKRSRLKLGPKAYKILTNEVHERDGWRCQVPYCGKRTTLHCHHIIYRSHGGDDSSWNLITVCDSCHTAIHNRYVIIMPTKIVIDGFEQPINADDKRTFKWYFAENWMPRKTLKKHT